MTGGTVLLARVGGIACAFPIEQVVETMRPLPIEPLTGVRYVLGLSIVRGEPIPVLDVAAAIGQVSREAARFVILRVGPRRVALLVDAVQGVETLSAETLAPLPPLLAGASDAATAIGRLDRELLLALDAARVVPT